MDTKKIYKLSNGTQWQILAVADLRDDGPEMFARLSASADVPLVCSDPPWAPRTEAVWRREANVTPVAKNDYDGLLDAWFAAIQPCNPEHLIVQVSPHAEERARFLSAHMRSGNALSQCGDYDVCFGAPGARACQKPNRLWHFGATRLTTDPSGLSGEAMMRRVFEGLPDFSGRAVGDPCIGKGMTSRMAHYFGMNCVGTELNPARLEFTVRWLLKHGYKEQ